MAELPLFRAKIDPTWIDYNGHLRDAYYGLIASLAIDEVMDYLGLDAAYRERTHGTLYTLEVHLHYLHEVKQSDDLQVHSSVLAFDRKRIHLGCTFLCSRLNEPVATAEMMLLHVRQGDKPASAPFPDEVTTKLEALAIADGGATPRPSATPSTGATPGPSATPTTGATPGALAVAATTAASGLLPRAFGPGSRKIELKRR